MASNITKTASRLSAAAAVTVPVLGLAGGALAGQKFKQKAEAEGKRIKVWRGPDGTFAVVRTPKTKTAFDRKMQLCLAAAGRDIDKVAAAYEAELEKIAIFNMLGRAVGGVGRAAVGGIRSAGSAAGAARQAISGAASGGTEFLGRTAGNIRSGVGQAVESFRAGVAGLTPEQYRSAQRLQATLGTAPQAVTRRTGRGSQGGEGLERVRRQRLQARLQAADQAAKPPPAPRAAAEATPAASAGGETVVSPQQMAAPVAEATPAVAATPVTSTSGGVAVSPQQMAAAGSTQGAATNPGMFQRAQQAILQRYNLSGLPSQPISLQNVSQWFSQLDPQKQAELIAMMGVGAAGTGFVGGTSIA